MAIRPGMGTKFGRMTVAEFIEHHIELAGLKQAQVAREAGFDKPNMITMLKQGKTKVPLSRVGALADALGVSRTYFLRLVLGEYHPEVLPIMQEVFGFHVSRNEFAIIEFVREVSRYSDPGLCDEGAKDLLRKAFGGPVPGKP